VSPDSADQAILGAAEWRLCYVGPGTKDRDASVAVKGLGFLLWGRWLTVLFSMLGNTGVGSKYMGLVGRRCDFL